MVVHAFNTSPQEAESSSGTLSLVRATLARLHSKILFKNIVYVKCPWRGSQKQKGN